MEKSEAISSIKNVVSETFSLNPSACISLFEIDISEIGFALGIVTETDIVLKNDIIFRFHNNTNTVTRSLFWQGNEYIAAPINAQGFDMSSKGSVANPKLSITVSDEGIPYLSILKDRIYQLGGDIVGAKVTRIRTFAKFIDIDNFNDGIVPKDYSPDPNAEISRDVFYIDRKSSENKNSLEFELSPIFDLQGIKLPGRLVSANSCPFLYRGHGCLYEYISRKNSEEHEDGTLPSSAPPVANFLNEKFSVLLPGIPLVDRGLHNKGQAYNKGEYVYIEHRNIKYYFVSKMDINTNSPPDSRFWLADECSKNILGCKLRWLTIGNGTLPYGGFPSTTRFR